MKGGRLDPKTLTGFASPEQRTVTINVFTYIEQALGLYPRILVFRSGRRQVRMWDRGRRRPVLQGWVFIRAVDGRGARVMDCFIAADGSAIEWEDTSGATGIHTGVFMDLFKVAPPAPLSSSNIIGASV